MFNKYKLVVIVLRTQSIPFLIKVVISYQTQFIMRTFVNTYLNCYLVYVQVLGFLPFQFRMSSLEVRPSRFRSIYATIFGVSLIIGQVWFYRELVVEAGSVDFQQLNVFIIAIMYTTGVTLCTSIVIHYLFTKKKVFILITSILETSKEISHYKTDGLSVRTNRLFYFFVVKSAFYEVVGIAILSYHFITIRRVDFLLLMLKSNLCFVSILTSIFVGSLTLMSYNLTILNAFIAQIRKKIKLAISKKSDQLTFRYCDQLDEVSKLHRKVRRLSVAISKLLQLLVLIILFYHWFDFVAQAYVFYLSVVIHRIINEQIIIAYLVVLLTHLVNVIFVCVAANSVMRKSTETGNVLQSFNEFELDPRLEKNVLFGCIFKEFVLTFLFLF